MQKGPEEEENSTQRLRDPCQPLLSKPAQTGMGEEPECFSARAVHQRVCSAVSPVTRCANTQGTPLLAPSVGLISTLECQRLALVSLSCCFHKSTSMDPLKSCPGTVVVEHLDPLWELLRQFRLWPSPAPMHMPCGSPHCPLADKVGNCQREFPGQ